MIIRKPYAFLIKNFRRIHIVLLLMSIFVAYKLIDISKFVNEFMRYGTYDLFKDPVTKHISFWVMICIAVLFLGSLALLFLLLHKQKPWKVYLVPVIEYAILFLVLSMIKSFFNGYSADVETTDLRMSKDLLMIFMIVQLPAIGIYVMRVFGLDIKKFQFNSDQEFLELSDADREEVEISLGIDKNYFIRLFRKLKRHFGYFYVEHKKICRAIVAIIIVLLCFRTYHFFQSHRSYSQGDDYSANGYTFKINHVYYTDKDINGNVIDNVNSFVIMDITIQNHLAPRLAYIENFHLRNGASDYVTTRKTYAKEFQDLGNVYESTKELRRDESIQCIIIYKVDKKLKKKKFVLYYQEDGGILRKIKLKIEDISEIQKAIHLKSGKEFPIEIFGKSDSISFDEVKIVQNTNYSIQKCSYGKCQFSKKSLQMDEDHRIIEAAFASDSYTGMDLTEFLQNYGKVIYKDSDGLEQTVDIQSPITKTYYGKTIFLKVPVEVEASKEVSLDIVVRNKHYVYRLI